jgi:hypothetical protein
MCRPTARVYAGHVVSGKAETGPKLISERTIWHAVADTRDSHAVYLHYTRGRRMLPAVSNRRVRMRTPLPRRSPLCRQGAAARACCWHPVRLKIRGPRRARTGWCLPRGGHLQARRMLVAMERTSGATAPGLSANFKSRAEARAQLRDPESGAVSTLKGPTVVGVGQGPGRPAPQAADEPGAAAGTRMARLRTRITPPTATCCQQCL